MFGAFKNGAAAGGCCGNAGAAEPCTQPCAAMSSVDLFQYLDLSKSESKNVHEQYPMRNALSDQSNQVFMMSDADPQIILNLKFTQKVRLHALQIRSAAGAQAPHTVKLYANAKNMDFDNCENDNATQKIVLAEKDFNDKSTLNTNSFLNVESLTVFIEDNGGADNTIVTQLRFFGQPTITVDHTKFEKAKGCC